MPKILALHSCPLLEHHRARLSPASRCEIVERRARRYQAALEAAQLGHGYLTYALVEEGLKTKSADTSPADGQVFIREWLDYATRRVPQMQQNKIQEQQKQGRQLELVLKFAESDTGTQRSVQRPRVFYRREVEMNPLVVAKP